MFYFFLYFSLHWVFIAAKEDSTFCGTQALYLQLLCSISLVHRLSCSVTCGIFLDQGSNPCPLHWQTDSYPLYHQWSPQTDFFVLFPLPPPNPTLFLACCWVGRLARGKRYQGEVKLHPAEFLFTLTFGKATHFCFLFLHSRRTEREHFSISTFHSCRCMTNTSLNTGTCL